MRNYSFKIFSRGVLAKQYNSLLSIFQKVSLSILEVTSYRFGLTYKGDPGAKLSWLLLRYPEAQLLHQDKASKDL